MSVSSPTSSPEDSLMSSDDEDSTYDSAVMCPCDLPAKLIISMNRSPYRLFYNCPRGQYRGQCGFRQWFDEAMPTDSQHVDQINLISLECIQIQERISKMEEEQGQERRSWFKEREELNSQLSAAKSELNKIRSEIKSVNKSNPVSAGCRFCTKSVSSPGDSPKDYSSRSSPEGSSMSSPEHSEVMCFCMRFAKQQLSMTSRNPSRYFYHCPKRRSKQCGFFQWADEPIPTGNRRVDEMNLISSERNRLQERIDEMKEDWDRERSRWNKEKMELHLELSAVKDELDKINEIDGLDKIKSEIKLENDRLVKIKSEIKLENERLGKIKSEIRTENDRLDKIKSEIKLENDGLINIKRTKLEHDGLDKIDRKIKLENDGLINIKRTKLEHDGLDKIDRKIKLENDGPDKIQSEIKPENDVVDRIKRELVLESDGLVNIKRIKLENDGLDKVKSEMRLENEWLDNVESEIKLENESGPMPPLN